MEGKRKVATDDLKLGMYVCELDRPWLGSPFLFQGFPVRKQEEIDQLKACCLYVYIDTELSQFHANALKSSPMSPDVHFETERLNIHFEQGEKPLENRRPFEDEFGHAVTTYQKVHDYIREVWDDVRLGHSFSISGAKEVADQLVDSLLKNENALVLLAQLKSVDEYTTRHSLNVAILSILFGRYLDLDEEGLRLLGFAALLHDIGKMRIPSEVLNKPDRLSPDEVTLVKRHPHYGREILSGQTGIPGAVLSVAYSHHERVDGSGYPRGLSGNSIDLYTYIVSIVDVYDAITSDRVYHMGISPHEALNLMYGWAPNSFPRDLVETFIRCLGIYPIGSIVELSTGEVGVVVTTNRKHNLRPTLTLVLNRQKRPYPRYKMINMDLIYQAGDAIRITRILPSNAYGVNVGQVVQTLSQEAAVA